MALALQVLIVLLLSTSPVFAQKSVSNEDWPNVGRDQGGNRHSPLTQINRSNVSKLEVAWTFDTEDWSDGSNLPSRSAFEATPLVIDGVMYIPSPMSRLFALDAETGEKLWVFDSGFDRKVRRNLYANRGVSTWTDGKKRLLYLGDIEGRLWAVDAKTGKTLSTFMASESWRGSPMTYMVNGRQHVAIASGGNILSFALGDR